MDIMTVRELADTLRLMAVPVFLAFVSMVVLLSDLIFTREDERRWPAYLTIAGLAGGLFLWLQSWLIYVDPSRDNALFARLRELFNLAPQQPQTLFNGMFNPVGPGDMTLIATLLILIVALVVTLLSPDFLERRGLQRGEYYALLLLVTVGLIMFAGSQHLILLFLAVELLSIPLYILAGFARPALRSQESALKYFMLGAFASGILLYGIALVYGATGTLYLDQIRLALQSDLQAGGTQLVTVGGATNLMLVAGMTMILVGLGFKISAAPFHQWTPDVYQGAPTPVTALMVAGTKIGGIVALINVLVAFLPLTPWWRPMVAAIALLTMVVGNVGALLQTDIKRMLAYSSIAHAGYMLVALAGLIAGAVVVLPALLLYLGVYALMNLGAFAVIIALEETTGEEIVELEQFRGLGRAHPVLGLLLGFFLLSLAGFPPTAGFFAKFFLFTGATLAQLPWLVVAAVVLSVISLFYYARYIVAMFMLEPEAEPAAATEPDEEPERALPSFMVGTAVVVSALLILMLGLLPNPFLTLFG